MAYIIGMLSPEEQAGLERRGWEFEDPPKELVDAAIVEPDRLRMCWVDTDVFDVMNGPDWEGSQPHVALVGNFTEGFRIIGPYTSFDEAAAAHPGPDVWISTLERAIKTQKT